MQRKAITATRISTRQPPMTPPMMDMVFGLEERDSDLSGVGEEDDSAVVVELFDSVGSAVGVELTLALALGT